MKLKHQQIEADVPAVEVAGVTHRYGDQLALADVSFSVDVGALFGLLGPNGGGKTTLFRILSTLMRPSEGDTRVFGRNTAQHPDEVRKSLGVIFQVPALDAALTVEQNLKFHGALYGIPRETLPGRCEEVLSYFGLDARRSDRVDTLSGGLQRRVDLARGLLHRPPLLLMDEPTHGLDPIARREFWSAVNHLRKQEPITIMVATHLLDEAEQCDRVGIIHEGRLVAHGSPSALKADLGGETLWIESDSPRVLLDRIEARFGLEGCVAGRTVQISHPDAPALLPSLYEAFDALIESATVRKPTLEDVFMAYTGFRLTGRETFQTAR